MRVMIDTNVLVSALIFPGRTMDALMEKITTEHRLVLSSYVLDELFDVVRRKFPGKADAVDLFLLQLPYELVYASDNVKSDLFVLRDEDDYPVLHSAVVEDVDVLVTGDRDFEDVELDRPEILTPTQFLERF
jgi:putative PIN family toxin of toxin-antitoxin system